MTTLNNTPFEDDVEALCRQIETGIVTLRDKYPEFYITGIDLKNTHGEISVNIYVYHDNLLTPGVVN